jgi:hypothetical protein
MISSGISAVRFQQESLSALNRPAVRFFQESVSVLNKNWCPLYSRIGVRFTQELVSALDRNRCPFCARICISMFKGFSSSGSIDLGLGTIYSINRSK